MERVVKERRQPIPQVTVDGYAGIGVGDIGHILRFGFMDTGIRPVWRDVRLVGTAVTVRMPAGDIGLNREVTRVAQAGDVIVVDRGGETEYACWGGFAALLAKSKGIAGLIVDGAVTDSMEITELRWPVYSRTLSGLVGANLGGDGEINTTIDCGGVPVNPGDLIVADDDGIVVIRPQQAQEVLQRVRDRFGATPSIREWLRSGRSIMDYPNVRAFHERP